MVGGGEVLLLVVVCVMTAIAVLKSTSVETPHQESDGDSPYDYAWEESSDEALPRELVCKSFGSIGDVYVIESIGCS